MSADILAEARHLGHPTTLYAALHDRAYLATTRDGFDEAIPLFYKALEYVGRRQRDHVLVDLASSQVLSGDIMSHGRNACMQLAIHSNHKIVRWQATTALMYTAIAERDQPLFDLYRTALQLAPLDTWLAVGYRRYAAEGLRSFGDDAGATRVIQECRDIAAKHQIASRYVE